MRMNHETMVLQVMSKYQHLEVERRQAGVLLARFNRPEVLNAVNTRLGEEILDFFTRINSGMEDNALCVVLTGAGDRAFCVGRSEEHTSELQSLMRISYAVFCLKKKKNHT